MRATRLKLICSGITAAMRQAALPVDDPLEARSIQLAAALRGRLPTSPDRALCGPALRARQTTELLRLQATVSEGLRDQDHGDWAGRTLVELEAEQPGVLQAMASDPLFAPAGGESIEDLRARAKVFLGETAAMPGTTVAVTHGPFVRAAILCVLDAPAPSFWCIDTPPLSVTELSFDGRRWALRLAG